MFGFSSAKREVIEDAGIIGGCVAVQFVYATNSVFLSYLMSLGLNPLTIVVYTASITAVFLSPFSFHFERSIWPKKPSLELLIKLVIVSLGGVTMVQSLFLKGVKLTSPALATTMPNLAPGFIFLIAAAFGLEKLKAKCIYSKVKILGTLLCVIGAVAMSIAQSATENPIVIETTNSTMTSSFMLDREKIIGCIYLILAVLVLSASVVLQAWILGDFPAPLSLSAITSLLGAIMTAILELIEDGEIDTGRSILGVRNLICFYILGGIVNAASSSFNAWAMKKRGPVLVSMFSPIATIVSAILSYIMLGHCITLGSVTGMLLVFSGLYFFLWAKGKEDFHMENGDGQESHQLDMEKALIS